MKNLTLHIGHGKTGTSFIQSVLANNFEILESNGIFYPKHESFDYAIQGKVSSGNQDVLLNDLLPEVEMETLISGERLFNRLAVDNELLEKILRKAEHTSVILYTRDVVEFLASVWSQSIKRGGKTLNFTESLSQLSDLHHARVLHWIKKAKQLGFELKIRNYSRHKEDLLEVFLADCFGTRIYRDDLLMPEVSIVNRSLSHVEIEIQKVTNTIGRNSFRFISDRLVNSLPNIRPSVPQVDYDTFSVAHRHYQPLIDQINEELCNDERLYFGSEEIFVGQNVEQNTLSYDQLEVISQGMIAFFSTTLAHKESVDFLRDLALKIENADALTLEDALELMNQAKKMRPNGPLINQKVDEWSDKLKSQDNE